ncbi:hypothetical protein [Sphaerisporangium perillae]|uniref:hypothetical protein n=1 Tax=Sphaerisporangium perillae TaxID=2935860 RepID=UPI00200C7344|nr:hypothetical protein [Sphaerisporangium perillae]
MKVSVGVVHKTLADAQLAAAEGTPPLISPTALENVVPLPQIPTGDPRVLAVSHTDR